MTILRRIDDAICAFLTGHGRRDLDRVRRRRLRLLGTRVAERALDMEALYLMQDWPEAARLHGDLAATVIDLVDRAVQRGERVAQAALAQQLHVERASLYMRRRQEFLQGHVLDGRAHGAGGPFETAWVAAPERYGKLYEGLAEEFPRNLRLHKLRLHGRYGHRLILLVRRLVGRSSFSHNVDRVEPAGPDGRTSPSGPAPFLHRPPSCGPP